MLYTYIYIYIYIYILYILLNVLYIYIYFCKQSDMFPMNKCVFNTILTCNTLLNRFKIYIIYKSFISSL